MEHPSRTRIWRSRNREQYPSHGTAPCPSYLQGSVGDLLSRIDNWEMKASQPTACLRSSDIMKSGGSEQVEDGSLLQRGPQGLQTHVGRV